MSKQEIYDKLISAVKHEIKDWEKADKITPLEQQGYYQPVISGICIAALYLLNTDQNVYFKFIEEVRALGGNP